MIHKRKSWLMIIIIMLFIILGSISIIYWMQTNQRKTIEEHKNYDASKKIEQAFKKMKKEEKKADVLTDVQTTKKLITLNFKSLSNSVTNRKILGLLEQYGVKSTFFVPGIGAAEDSDLIKQMDNEGHRVESNTLTENKKLDQEPIETLIEDFCKTNKILKDITGRSPELLMANQTRYNETVLKAAYASGNERVVSPTNYLSYQSFKNYEQVLDYVNAINGGTILTVKLDGPLEADEYKESKTNEKPAVDMQATVDPTKAVSNKMSPEEQLLLMIEWLLKAIQETKTEIVFTADINTYEDNDFNKDFQAYRDKNNGKLAEVITRITNDEKMVSFTFKGIGNEENLQEILRFLDENKTRATFFVTGDDLKNKSTAIKEIIAKGHQIGNGGLTGKDATLNDFNQVCFEIYKLDKLLKENGITTNIFMPAYGKYNDTVRESASSLGYQLVSYNKNPITNATMTMKDIMDYFKNGLKDGDIIYFSLTGNENVAQAVAETYKLAMKQNLQFASVNTMLSYHTVMAEVENKSIHYTSGKPSITDKDLTTNTQKQIINTLQKLRSENKGKLALVMNGVYTTERALSYTFTGISNTKVLNDVLRKLDKINAKGTFFVTEEETVSFKDSIKEIASAGHDIEICINPTRGEDFYTVGKSILAVQKAVNEICGKTPNLVRCAYVINMSDEMLEAISSAGCTVVWQNISFANSNIGKNGSFNDVINLVYNNGNISAKRGDILFFRMDYYEDSTTIGKLLMDFTKNKVNNIAYKEDGNSTTKYQIKTVNELLQSNLVYQYPVVDKSLLPALKNRIYAGHLKYLSETDLLEFFSTRYVGNPNIISTALPGFTEEQLETLDKTGTFTEDKVLFLTFDDWGSDKPIDQILYVLGKYNVKSNFFVRTNYLESNPNLLRAIALDGHEVGSHTDQHYPFANSMYDMDEDDVKGVYTSISDEDATVRKKDLQISYEKLLSVIGDVEVNNKASLSTIFRPPTLAMSRKGMETIFDMGFSYIVSGDFSTHDYEAKNAQELANTLLNGIVKENGSVYSLQNGSVVVLHMSDDSSTSNNNNDITAEALDIVIPKLLEQGYSFAKLSQYLSE